MDEPLSPPQAWDTVDRWIDAPACWIPAPGRGDREILRGLVTGLEPRGHLVSDAALAALCIEHGLETVSADSDVARFTEVTWVHPVRD